MVRAAVADPVGGGGGRGRRVDDPVGPVCLPRSDVVAVGGGAGAVAAGPEQLVRLGLQLLRMRRLLTNEGSLKGNRAENGGKLSSASARAPAAFVRWDWFLGSAISRRDSINPSPFVIFYDSSLRK